MKKLLKRFALWVLKDQNNERLSDLEARLAGVTGDRYRSLSLEKITRPGGESRMEYRVYAKDYDWHYGDTFQDALELLADQINRKAPAPSPKKDVIL